MPQLDITAYFSEYLWTVISFFIFYYVLSKFFLPSIGRALLFEEKKYSADLSFDLTDMTSSSRSNEKLSPHTLWSFGTSLLHESGFPQKKISYINMSSLSQKKTELCTKASLYVLTYPPFLSLLRKDPEILHQSFLEYSED